MALLLQHEGCGDWVVEFSIQRQPAVVPYPSIAIKSLREFMSAMTLWWREPAIRGRRGGPVEPDSARTGTQERRLQETASCRRSWTKRSPREIGT
jgi:hypothetical protein